MRIGVILGTARIGATRRIVVFGNHGSGNLGDEATLQALIEQLRARLPKLEIVSFSVNPADTAARYGIRAEPATRRSTRFRPSSDSAVPSRKDRIRAGLQRSPALLRLLRGIAHASSSVAYVAADPLFELRRIRTLQRADFLVIGGGGQLSEHVGVFASLPFHVFKMTLLARLARTPVALLNVGVGPLERRISRIFVRTVLRLADYRSFRDESSRALAERLGTSGPFDVYPDLAWGLDALRPRPEASTSQGVVAINVFPHSDGRYVPAVGSRYDDYLERVVSLTIRVLERGHTVALFPTQLRADPPAIADLKARLAATGGWERHVEQVIEPQLTTVDELLRFLCSADIVVATRFHAIVLALALARPVIAFSNHSKMDQAMSEMGQEAYVFRADEADTEVLGEAFDRLEANLGAIGAELEERASDHRALLEGQLDQLFGQRRDGLTAAALPVVAGVPRR